jgi:L-gulonolactone oxidase
MRLQETAFADLRAARAKAADDPKGAEASARSLLHPTLSNWFGLVSYVPQSLEVVRHVDDIVRIVKNSQRYPSPVRAKGSHHSTTDAIVAQGGTVIDMTHMNRILEINEKARTITMEAGVLHIDAAKELEKHNLQFYVNIELGNMTVGSGACCATKDASFYSNDENRYEFGQVCSYVIGYKAVQADGSILKVDESQPELLAAMRSSYGMLGIVYEVTFRVKELRPMAFEHVLYPVEEFTARLDEIIAQNRSTMMYLFPFHDKVVCEHRHDGSGRVTSNSWQWQLRNIMWETVSPTFGKTVRTFVPTKAARDALLQTYNALAMQTMTKVLRGTHSSAADQIIRYPKKGGYGAYTFSIWGFPRDRYAQALLDYFAFCKRYYRENGYRCDLLNVGYSIAQDRSSLFSYTRKQHSFTFDPVCTAGPGWDGFVTSYNEFCIQHGGHPLFNQTPGITPLQVKAAFGEEIEQFQRIRKQYDPNDRFYNHFFRWLFE